MTAPSVLFLDCETSGLYLEKLSIDDPQQPWCPQIAAALCTDDGEMVNFFSHLVKADGRKVKENALKVHGITDRACSQVGLPEPRILGILADMLKTAPVDRALKVVTYGDFDFRVVSSLFARFAVSQGKDSSAYDRLWLRRPLIEKINLMTPWAQMACRIKSEFEGSDEFKWPSLDEARQIILGKPQRQGFHDAWEDMLDLKELYFRFVKDGVLEAAS